MTAFLKRDFAQSRSGANSLGTVRVSYFAVFSLAPGSAEQPMKTEETEERAKRKKRKTRERTNRRENRHSIRHDDVIVAL